MIPCVWLYRQGRRRTFSISVTHENKLYWKEGSPLADFFLRMGCQARRLFPLLVSEIVHSCALLSFCLLSKHLVTILIASLYCSWPGAELLQLLLWSGVATSPAPWWLSTEAERKAFSLSWSCWFLVNQNKTAPELMSVRIPEELFCLRQVTLGYAFSS